MFDATVIVEAIAALIATIITAILIPYIKSKTTENQQKQINGWVKLAVQAAEQIYVGSGLGKQKKEYVKSFLESKGITLDEERINVLIEAAVYELKTGIIKIE